MDIVTIKDVEGMPHRIRRHAIAETKFDPFFSWMPPEGGKERAGAYRVIWIGGMCGMEMFQEDPLDD